MSKMLRDRLVGAWELQEYSVTSEDGTVFYPMGRDASGLIIYTPDGYMSAQIMKPGRPPYAAGDMQGGTSEELSTAARGYVAYSGPYCVDEEHETLHHNMALSLFPNWIGDVQARHAHLDGELLTLSPAPARYGGQRITPRLVWKRARQNGPMENAIR
jgi:hypothetical protein